MDDTGSGSARVGIQAGMKLPELAFMTLPTIDFLKFEEAPFMYFQALVCSRISDQYFGPYLASCPEHGFSALLLYV